ncbi:hypothetical protein F9B85_09475 [Heliorestis acidaminivorans]|uniref:Uncharacterized protein n=1 Tax=Heliorestis acidaminivorans TaxID=553427 RepID=A0A6I0EQG9_9FIRM|nr:hypothetical protein [Heliorestis acidaminivorans]KAB2952374.1 hypothetical protein F9B85_09475 [Heliorestis acidaminivorans]
MAERSIIAYFKESDLAEDATKHLKQKGFETVRMDNFHHFPEPQSAERYFNPLTGDERRSVTALSEGIEGGDDTSPLAAAMPTASGMSDNSTFITGENYIVTVVCDEQRFEEAQQLLASYGGNVGV